MKYIKSSLIFWMLVLIIPLTMACSLSRVVNEVVGEPTPEVIVVVPTEAPTQALPPTAEPPAPPPEPTATPEPTQNPGVCTHVDHFNVCVPPELASSLVVSTVPENNDQNGAPWEIAPENKLISLEGYPLSDTLLSARIIIYPLDRFRELQSEAIQGTVDSLTAFINSSNPASEKLPYLPFANAMAMIRTRELVYKTDQIQGGSMVTQFGQAYSPINNHDSFYTFQGMTNDGKYYISITMPITQQSLAANGNEIPGGDMEAFSNFFTPYVEGVTQELNGADPSTFSPNLDLIQAIAQGITYQP